jgi:predicted dehydrogenase
MKRRHFLMNASTLAAGSLFLPKFLKAVAPSDRINIALIGANGMGWSNLSSMLKNPQARVVGLCDVDGSVLDRRVAELAKQNIAVKTYSDYRSLLENKDIDAVIVGTPDHWHCLQMIDAVQAGKDVYVEKPIGNSIAECNLMLKAQQATNRAVQVGQWQRSMPHFQDAMRYVHSGKLGRVRLVKAWAYMGWMKMSLKPQMPKPDYVDYDRWLGPAPKRPFDPNRFHFDFRWYWDYAGGMMTDWGVHLLDFGLFGMQASQPKSVLAAGGKMAYPDTPYDTPDTATALFEFEHFNLQWEHAVGISGGPYNRDHGIAFLGNNGTLVVNRNGWEVIAEGDRMETVPLQKPVGNGLDLHTKNFLEVVQSRDLSQLHCTVQQGVAIANVCQMGNIAYRTGKRVYWDASNQVFTDKQANKFLTPVYHNNYKLPKI